MLQNRTIAGLLAAAVLAVWGGSGGKRSEAQDVAAPTAVSERGAALTPAAGGKDAALQGFNGAPEIGGVPPMPPQAVRTQPPGVRVQVVAKGLTIPWALAFARDGRIFFTERPGRVKVMRLGSRPRLYLNLSRVISRGEGGLMGLALHPGFPNPPYLYAMYTFRRGKSAFNRISRFTDRGGRTAGSERVLVDGITAAQFHDGGALAFGPDGMLYAGTGDALNPPIAQDLGSFNGKILRITPEGGVPEDNPFPNSPVWAYGFRNVTGLTWSPQTGELWAASHGPSGEYGLRARDTVYVVRRGGNHGWPLVTGTTSREDIVSPVLYYPENAVPPGGLLFYTGRLLPRYQGDLFMPTLGSTHLQRIVVEDGRRIETIERWWPGRFGRLRAVAQGRDGALYFTTSNRDGRAQRPYSGSDYIYRLLPSR